MDIDPSSKYNFIDIPDFQGFIRGNPRVLHKFDYSFFKTKSHLNPCPKNQYYLVIYIPPTKTHYF